MKKIRLKYLMVLLGVTSVITSCLDEDPFVDPADTEGIIELFDIGKIETNPGGSSLPHAYLNSYDIVEEGDSLGIIVSYSGAYSAPEDLTITLIEDDSLLAQYNRDNETSYVKLPDSLYALPAGGYNFRIPKGEKKASISIWVDAFNFDPSVTYALPLVIESASQGTISGNFNKSLYLVNVKNKYDGIYKLRFYFQTTRSGLDTTQVWEWPGDVQLRTTGANTVDLFDDWGYEEFYHPIRTSAGGWSAYGSASPKFAFDLETDKVISVSNHWLNPSNGRDFTIDDPTVTKESYFEESTHNVYAQFVMTQSGYPNVNITDSLIYVGPR